VTHRESGGYAYHVSLIRVSLIRGRVALVIRVSLAPSDTSECKGSC
jgi:hypothetical protein